MLTYVCCVAVFVKQRKNSPLWQSPVHTEQMCCVGFTQSQSRLTHVPGSGSSSASVMCIICHICIICIKCTQYVHQTHEGKHKRIDRTRIGTTHKNRGNVPDFPVPALRSVFWLVMSSPPLCITEGVKLSGSCVHPSFFTGAGKPTSLHLRLVHDTTCS